MFNKAFKIGKEHKQMSKTSEFLLLNLGILLVSIGVYFFKIPNNFAIGGVSGIAVILGKMINFLSPANLILILNLLLLLIGFLFLGKGFGIKTAYSAITLSLLVEFYSIVFPMSKPLTNEPFLELIFSVLLPGIGAALLFNIKASSGGTDVIAMILKKKSHIDIGRAIFISDFVITCTSFYFFDTLTALCSILGLFIKSLLVDVTIENINRVKYFFIVTEKPDEITEFITTTLHRGGTRFNGEGIFAHQEKSVITVVCNNYEAVLLRDFINKYDPKAFVTIVNTSQIIGKGFRNTF